MCSLKHLENISCLTTQFICIDTVGENKDGKFSDIMSTIYYACIYKDLCKNSSCLICVTWIPLLSLVLDAYIMVSGNEGTRLTGLTLLGITEACKNVYVFINRRKIVCDMEWSAERIQASFPWSLGPLQCL